MVICIYYNNMPIKNQVDIKILPFIQTVKSKPIEYFSFLIYNKYNYIKVYKG